MAPPSDPYCRGDLALVHHRGFSFTPKLVHQESWPYWNQVQERHRLVLEIGCGSGLLTEDSNSYGYGCRAPGTAQAQFPNAARSDWRSDLVVARTAVGS
jgi:hypothetical protein